MTVNIREAKKADVPSIVFLLANDELGSQRENCQDPLPKQYYDAFSEIDTDNNNYLIVVENEGEIIGTCQLTIIPYLTYKGGKRGQIEGVRIDGSCRGQGIGEKMIRWAIDKAKERNCHLVQLTMDKKREETIKFYQKIGFVASHEGLKLYF